MNIKEIKNLWVYRSKRSGLPFKVLDIVRHGQDCSQLMIVYTNCVETEDYPAFTRWVISEEMFLKRFEEWGEK